MCLLIWKKKSLYNLRLPSTQKYFYLCSWCMAKCVPRFLILGALHWLHTVKNASRVNVHQLFGCITIQMMPFNSIMNVNYDWKSALKLSFSRKKMLNLFLKDFFVVMLCIFLFCYKLWIECQRSIFFSCFWYWSLWERLIPQCIHISVLQLLLNCSC